VADLKTGPTVDVRELDLGALPVGAAIGRYEIVGILGQGGFGITYRARDAQLGREVAIKEYLPSSLALRQDGVTVLPRTTKMAEDFTWGRQRFVEEGRTLATLHDAPAIVRVFDFLEANGTAYIVMELVSGETLEHRLSQKGRLSPSEVDAVLWPLLDGLEQVHNAGFLHRDIKPGNILLNAAGKPTLIDFGASRAAMAGRTTAMTAVFTPGYAAPEQMTSAKQGPWTDIYGVSATLYHAITGRAPPNSFDRMLDDGYEPLGKQLPAGFASGLLAGIDVGLAVRATDRPQSIAGWRPILAHTGGRAAAATVAMRPTSESIARPAPEPTIAPMAASVAEPARPAAKNWALLYGGIAAVVLALAVGGYLMFAAKPQPQSATVQDMKVEQLEQVLAERRKADVEATEKRRQEQEARDKKAAEATAKVQANSELEKARVEREKAEQELAQLKAQIEGRRKEEADQRKMADDEAAKRKAEAELAALQAAERQAQQKAAEQAAAKRQADEALDKAQEERKKADEAAAARAQAETEAKAKADAETRQKADAELAAATDKKVAEAGETALRLGQPERQRLQVALTSLGFDTRGSDGAFGPRSREMIGAWQKALNLPSTGFLNVAQQQALLKKAAPAVARFDEEQKKAEEEKKKAEEAKKKAEEEAKAKAPATPGPPPAPATPAPSPPPAPAAAAAAGAATGAVVDGLYSGAMTAPVSMGTGMQLPVRVTLEMVSGRGTGTIESFGSTFGGSQGGPISIAIAPDGSVSGNAQFVLPQGLPVKLSVAGRAAGSSIKLDFTGFGRPASMALNRVPR
jgi:peptidoglycan hydrolase-like protein with peptidoglycan-binding domain